MYSPRNSTRPMRFALGFGKRNSRIRTVNDMFMVFVLGMKLAACVWFHFYLLRATVYCFVSTEMLFFPTQNYNLQSTVEKSLVRVRSFVTHSERCWWCHNSNPLRGMFVFCIFDSVCLFFQRPFENWFFFFSSTVAVVQITYLCRTNAQGQMFWFVIFILNRWQNYGFCYFSPQFFTKPIFFDLTISTESLFSLDSSSSLQR